MSKRAYKSCICKLLQVFTLTAFCVSNLPVPPSGFAQNLTPPAPPAGLNIGTPFTPSLIRGLTIDPENPFKFNFIIDAGDLPDEPAFKAESAKLIRYFMAALTVPDKELWVNLSPYEPQRIIPENFGRTDMGLKLLAQDYLLKQLTSSLAFPENELGQTFWERVHAKTREIYGHEDVSIDAFNRIWIVPASAVIHEQDTTVFVVESRLKVMLEEDYLASQKAKHPAANENTTEKLNAISSQMIREILIPEIEKEINTGKNFAPLRQIYNSVILASWYKQKFKQSLLGPTYVGKNKINGVESADEIYPEDIYRNYMAAFKKGASTIYEHYDPAAQQVIPRKYFTGGVVLAAQTTSGRFTDAAAAALRGRKLFSVDVEMDRLGTRGLSHHLKDYLDKFGFTSGRWIFRTALAVLLLTGAADATEKERTILLPYPESPIEQLQAEAFQPTQEEVDAYDTQLFEDQLNKLKGYQTEVENTLNRYQLPDLEHGRVSLDLKHNGLETEAKLRMQKPFTERWMFDSALRLGVLGLYNPLTDGILEDSPYAALDLGLLYDGYWTTKLALGAAAANINLSALPVSRWPAPLHRLYDVRQNDSQDWMTASLYFDTGKTVVLVDKHVGLSAYVHLSALGMSNGLEIDPYQARGFIQASSGGNMVFLWDRYRLRLYGYRSAHYDTLLVASKLIDEGAENYDYMPVFGQWTVGGSLTRSFHESMGLTSHALTVGYDYTETESAIQHRAYGEYLFGRYRLRGDGIYETPLSEYGPEILKFKTGLFFRPAPYYQIGMEGYLHDFRTPSIPPFFDSEHTLTGGVNALSEILFDGDFKLWSETNLDISFSTPHRGTPATQAYQTSVSSAGIDSDPFVEGIELGEEGEEILRRMPGVGYVYENSDAVIEILKDYRDDNKLTPENEQRARAIWEHLRTVDWSQINTNDLSRLKYISLYFLSKGQFLQQTVSNIFRTVDLIQNGEFSADNFHNLFTGLQTAAIAALAQNTQFPAGFWSGLITDFRNADYRGIGEDFVTELKLKNPSLFNDQRLDQLEETFSGLWKSGRLVAALFSSGGQIAERLRDGDDLNDILQDLGNSPLAELIEDELRSKGFTEQELTDAVTSLGEIDYRHILEQNGLSLGPVEALLSSLSPEFLESLGTAAGQIDLDSLLKGNLNISFDEAVALVQSFIEDGPREVKDLIDTIYQVIEIYESVDGLIGKFFNLIGIGFKAEEITALQNALSVLEFDMSKSGYKMNTGAQTANERYLNATEMKLRGQPFLSMKQPDAEAPLELVEAWRQYRALRKAIARMDSIIEYMEAEKIKAEKEEEEKELTPVTGLTANDHDPAQTGDVGGIDLDPALIDLKTDGSGEAFPLPDTNDFPEPVEFRGLAPVIINIAPVTNLPLILGLAELPENPQQLSRLP